MLPGNQQFLIFPGNIFIIFYEFFSLNLETSVFSIFA